jgi:hypothetical protein
VAKGRLLLPDPGFEIRFVETMSGWRAGQDQANQFALAHDKPDGRCLGVPDVQSQLENGSLHHVFNRRKGSDVSGEIRDRTDLSQHGRIAGIL